MSVESLITIGLSLFATAVAIWSIRRQDVRDRTQGTKIHEERAAVVRSLYKLMYQYKEAFVNFYHQTNAEDYYKGRLIAGELVMKIYHLKQENLMLFPVKKHKLLHDGIEAMERIHRWTLDLGHARWSAVERKVDPDKDPNVLDVFARMTADAKKNEPLIARLHKFLRRSMGVDA